MNRIVGQEVCYYDPDITALLTHVIDKIIIVVRGRV